MGKTKIEWADYTFNPWIGCTKVSPGCYNCYAEAQNEHWGWMDRWGPKGPRKRTSPANWKKPLTWNRKAAREGVRYKVFCASLADVFDDAAPDECRDDLFALIDQTPNLDWLLLTKRPENFTEMLPENWGNNGWQNVWLGVTAENQEMANKRIPILLETPAAKRFVSIEPMLGPVDINKLTFKHCPEHDSDSGFCMENCGNWVVLDWVIVGGESGPKARPMSVKWIHDVYQQCLDAKVPFFFKQWGEWIGGGADGKGWNIYHDGSYSPNWDHKFDGGGCVALRVGKKQAGHKLGGRAYREFPEARNA